MIYPAAGRSESEFERLAPPNVLVHVTRIKWSREDKEQLLAMESYLSDAAMLLAQARVDLILFNCTTCSLVKGFGYDQYLISLIEKATDIPAMTTATAAVLAMRKLGLQKITLLTAYPEEMNAIETDFLNKSGIELATVRGAGMTDPFEQYSKSPKFWYEFVLSNFDKRSQGVFLSCAGIRVVDIIERLERVLGVPVVASNQVAMWACLSKMGIEPKVDGFGKLMR
jgi:maleate isomerase